MNVIIFDAQGQHIGWIGQSDQHNRLHVQIEGEFHWIGDYLNSRLLSDKPIVGTDGVRKIVNDLSDQDQQGTLFTKIESLSQGKLHVEIR